MRSFFGAHRAPLQFLNGLLAGTVVSLLSSSDREVAGSISQAETILSPSAAAHYHLQDAERDRDPKQNPQRKPESGADSVRIKKLAAPVTAESPLATQDEYERHDDAAGQLRRDRIILRPGNLVSCVYLTASWTFESHKGPSQSAIVSLRHQGGNILNAHRTWHNTRTLSIISTIVNSED